MKRLARFADRNKLLIFLFFVFIFLLIINMKTPMIGEDFGLSPTKASWHNLSVLQRISLISHKIWTQYTQWNSRLGEQIAIFFLGFDKLLFNICNSLLVTGLIVLIFFYAFGRLISPKDTDDLIALTLIFSLFICFLPKLGEVTFWLAGSTNYLWGVFILLIFFVPYRLAIFSSKVSGLGIVPTVTLTILGALAGMTNENTVPVILLLIIFMVVDFRTRNVQLPAWFISGLVSLLVGYAALMLSPSTDRRIRFYAELFGVQEATFSHYIVRMQNVLQAFIQSSKFLLVIFFVTGTALLIMRLTGNGHRSGSHKLVNNYQVPKNLKAMSTVLIFSSISAFILIGNAYFEVRAFLLINLMLIAAIVAFVFDKKVYARYRQQIRVLAALLLVLAIWNIRDIYRQYSSFSREAQARHSYILKAISEGQERVTVTTFKAVDSRVLTTREVWLINSGQYGLYYGINDIEFVERRTD